MTNRNYTLVVARFKEDIEWAKEVFVNNVVDNIIIYNKSDEIPDIISINDVRCETLPNIGRESHTYLFHIVTHYDSMCHDGCTLFCQGRIDDHCITSKTLEENLSCTIQKAVEKGGYCAVDHSKQPHNVNTSRSTMSKFRIQRHRTNENDEWQQLDVNPRNENFGAWFERVLGRSFPNLFRGFMPGGLFAVANSCILSKPKECYEKLLAELQTSNPEVGHFFERSWSYIFESD